MTELEELNRDFLDGKVLTDLKVIAKQLNIPGISKMKKEELVEKILKEVSNNGMEGSSHGGKTLTKEDTRVSEKEKEKKVRVELHPQTDEVLARKVKAGQKPGFRSTIVELKTKGKKFEIEVPEPRGAPDNPPSETELLEKFRNNASFFGLEHDRTEQIIELILKLDELDNVRALTNMLAGDDR